MNHLTRCGKLGRPIALAFGHRKVKLGLHDACHRLCVGIDRLQTGTLGDYNDSIQRRWNLSVHSYRERADIEEEEPKAGSVPEDLQRREATGGKDPDKIQPKRLGKRKVAIFLGYEGTNYRGLQIQGDGNTRDTIEDVLESAIFDAGGILESNRGSLGKIGWSRSSRTDKRVHSLSTVISMKMECDAAVFSSHPDGLPLVEAINEHLPPEIRVFGVQRVVKSFDARRECTRRSYEYYLPVSFLAGMKNNDESLEKVLERLKCAWESYSGHHAFHNYTKRRLYRYNKVSKAPKMHNSNYESSEDDDLSDIESDGPEELHKSRRGEIQMVWKEEREEDDPVVRRHFRLIDECTCSTIPEVLTGGTNQCIKLRVKGASFMLHQIRHMVGGAVLVALGKIPLDLLKASLSAPARMNLPLAPPGCLVLRAAEFGKFRTSWDGRPSITEKTSGTHLILLEPGISRQEEFETSWLHPALDAQLNHMDWEMWADTVSYVHYDKDTAGMMIDKSKEWEGQRAMRQEERRLRIMEKEE